MPYKILFLGASYGSLLAAKLLPAGAGVTNAQTFPHSSLPQFTFRNFPRPGGSRRAGGIRA